MKKLDQDASLWQDYKLLPHHIFLISFILQTRVNFFLINMIEYRGVERAKRHHASSNQVILSRWCMFCRTIGRHISWSQCVLIRKNIIILIMCTYIMTNICACMDVCMYVRMHACMYVCFYVCMHVCMYVCMYVSMCVCICSMYACLYVCMFVRMYVCFYVSICE